MARPELSFPTLEAPSDVFWRVLGAATFALVDKENREPTLGKLDGAPFNKRVAVWYDAEGALNRLTVYTDQYSDSYVFTNHYVHEPTEADTIVKYTRFLFNASPDYRDKVSKLAVVRGIINVDDPASQVIQSSDYVKAIELGVAVPNGEDAVELYDRVLQGGLYEVSYDPQ